MLNINNSWLQKFCNDSENVLIFPDHSYEEIYLFANQLYHHGDIEDNKETSVENVSQPKVVYARKFKPSEVVTEVPEAGHRDGGVKRRFTGIKEATSDERNGDHEDEIVAKRPRTPLLSDNVGYESHFVENSINGISKKPRLVYARKSKPREIETAQVADHITEKVSTRESSAT